jgi:phosphate transport system substrate-binding protein
MRLVALGLLAAAFGAAVPSAQAATRIVAKDGTVITGDVISFENGIYKLKTAYGEMTIPATAVTSIDDEGGPAPAASGTLRLAGSTTVGDELAPALLEAFAASNGASDVTEKETGGSPEEVDLTATGPQDAAMSAHISRHGSATAFTALAYGDADIGMASRRINAQEAATLAAAGLGDVTRPGFENVVALDALIIVVNKDNPVNTLSMAQIRDLFTGAITDWSKLGGKPGPVHLYGRDSKSASADTFGTLVLSGGKPADGIIETKGAEDLSLKVLGDPAGIGYTGFAYLGDNKALTIVTECGLEFPPEDMLIRTEAYPLSRRLYLYAAASAANPEARAFIDFALGEKGQELARKNNFIDLTPELAPVQFGRNGVALAAVSLAEDHDATKDDLVAFFDFARHAVNGARVSTTFRFQAGATSLDARGLRDIDRVAEFLKSSAGHRNILVAGFSDVSGSSDANRTLSVTRAKSIAALLERKGVHPTEVVGYGGVAPVACNTDNEGRDKNRRVEIWLY